MPSNGAKKVIFVLASHPLIIHSPVMEPTKTIELLVRVQVDALTSFDPKKINLGKLELRVDGKPSHQNGCFVTDAEVIEARSR